ncbi:penicillin-binding protein 1A [Plastoroseomonas hellenica]|uniref:penicillin-binding protein 1A n=1 Tax=Plastoroseomonas hellenica TaxID=2687306 RepID=UPI001BAABCB8|nr:PBP1A family penicillin-binding protein [Plastoroseomonas hellenica]MBR0646387.1 PBP1A family penicillin-binding protein [Plastoroseomonas hellenica]
MSLGDLRPDGPLDPRRRGPAAPAPDAEPAPGKRKKERPQRPARKRRRGFGFLRLLLILGAGVAVAGGVGGYGLYRVIAADLPDYRWLADYDPPQMSRIYAADSRLMAELASERRVFVPIEAIPQRLQQAFVSAEDQRFWEHHGVDPIGIIRAGLTAVEQLGSGRRMGGASTITQQVAKNMLVGNDRTMTRKLREAILAVRLEQALPKERILEIYLNEIFLGAQAFGVAAAAQNYFNKSLDELTLAEMAFLAILPKAPNNYNPFRFPEAARARRDWVIDRMVEDRAVTAEEAAAAKAEPIVARPSRRPDMVAVGQHFTEEVRRDLIARFGAEQTTMGGLVVRTSLEPPLQAAAERALREGLMTYDRRRGGWRGPVTRISAAPTEWLPALDALQRPPGMQPEWRLAVALEVRDREARLGWAERLDARTPAQPRTAVLPFEDMAWARPVIPAPPGGAGAQLLATQGVRLGAAPRRMQDVLSPGDVVMVEVLPAAAAQGRTQARPERLALRQMPVAEGAIVALDPATGRVLAMVGGYSFERSWFNRATQAMRQPGSSFKPFVYISALSMGIPPNQQLLDEPIEIATPQGLWRPSNYSGGGRGWVTMRQALESSLNMVTVRLAQHIGMERISQTAADFGVIPNMPRYLSMALGAGETTVMRMAAGYAGFVNGGRQVTPTLIDSVQDRRGRVIWRADPRRCEPGCDQGPEAGPPALAGERRQIADPIAAYQMVSLLQGVVQRGTGTRAAVGLNRPVAGKTGTTDDYRDNWFVGFTPDIVIAVWLGFDEPRSLGTGETGGGTAAPIFHDVLQAALNGSPPVPFRAPPGVALVRIPVGNGSILEAFRPGTDTTGTQRLGESARESAAGLDTGLGGLY